MDRERKTGDQIGYSSEYGAYVVTGGGSKVLNMPLNSPDFTK